MDLFQKCHDYDRVKKAKELGIYPYFHMLTSGQDTEVIMSGHNTYMLGSNNYLGLTADPRVKEAVIEAVKKYGTGCSGSRFLNGNLDIHVELEAALAKFLNKEATLTFSTGFQTNLGIISAITTRNDVILADSMNHASLVDGCRLSFAKTIKYQHNDMLDLEKKLKHFSAEDKGILIITDGVFSMEGEICKLPEIVALGKKYGARIMVDDAHSLGVLGEGGRGTADHFGLTDDVDIIMNTFSKTLASLGGMIATTKEVIEYVRHVSRPFIFSASIPPAQVAAAKKALEILIEEPWRVKRLHEITHYMKEGIKANPHIRLRESGNELVPIVPILTGSTGKTMYTSTALLDAGVYVNPVFPPVVPADSCLLRTSYMATHTNEQLDVALGIMSQVFQEIENIKDKTAFDLDF